MPVGLISSANIPNPNGMGLLGFFLSVLPNLLSVSFFLGAVQIILLVLLAGNRLTETAIFFASVRPSSVILRSTSVGLINTITLINVFSFEARYLKNGSLGISHPLHLVYLAPPVSTDVNAIMCTPDSGSFLQAPGNG
jgi:hypothetical protein